MSRFFVPPGAVKGKNITINGQEAHHIVDVMRLKVSDEVVAFDGTGKEYAGVITATSRNSLTLEIRETRSNLINESFRITLLQALTKKEKMDYIIEKATELGVHAIVPVVTQRTVPDWDAEKKAARAERWRKMAREAAKQCGRADIPSISEVSDFTAVTGGFNDFKLKLIAILDKETVPVKDAVTGVKSGDIVIAIGPEGDFTADEARAAKEAGFKAISLGPRVLKSDTAGLALLSMLNYEFSR